MSLPENWTDLLNKDPSNIRWHEDWVIVRICSDDEGKTIYPKLYNEMEEGDRCYPHFLLAKPTHSGDIKPKTKFVNNPEEGDVFRGVFGNYRVVHVWNNQMAITWDLMLYSAAKADELSRKATMMKYDS